MHAMRNVNPIFAFLPVCIVKSVQGHSYALMNGNVKQISVRVDENFIT